MWAKTACLLLLVGCGNPGKMKVPEAYIQPNKMVEVLVDVHLIEGARSGNDIQGDSLQVDDYYKAVFVKHQISEENFRESFHFYSKHPLEFEKMFDQVIESIAKLETNLGPE